MKKTERHIGKFFRDPLPEPEVPGDDAWAGMNDMLNAAAGGAPIGEDAGKWFSVLFKIKGLIITLLSIISVTAFIIYQLSDFTVSTNEPAPALTQSEQPGNLTEKLPNQIRSEKIERHNTKTTNPEPEQAIVKQQRENLKPLTNDQKSQERFSTQVRGEETEWKIKSESLIAKSEKINNLSFRKSNSKPNRKPSNNTDLFKTINGRFDFRKTENPFQNPPSAGVLKENKTVDFTRDSQSLETALTLSSSRRLTLLNPKPIHIHFKTISTNMDRRIIAQSFPTQPESEKIKTNRTFHLGLEWSLNASLKSTSYIATGTDSIRRIGRLLIPGLFATKNWSKSSVTVSFLPYQSYFGDNKLVRQAEDSLSSDSVKTHSNTLFVKAIGMTFSAQYQYHVTDLFALNAGVSYNIFTSALFRPQVRDWQGRLLNGQLTTLKKSSEISPYINPRIFTLKAGIAVTPGRFQAGLNLILPLSKISKSPQFPIKALNGQIYLRYLVW